MGIPFVGEPVLPVEEPVIGGKNHQGLLQHALPLQFREDPPTHRVRLGHEPVVVAHHLLVLLWLVEPPMPADAALVALVRDEGRQAAVMRLRGRRRHRDADARVEPEALGLGQKLLRVLVLRVGRDKGEREAEGPPRWAGAQEFQGVRLVAAGNVHRRALGLRQPVPHRGDAPGAEVILLRRKLPVVPLAYVADVVTRDPQAPGIRLGPGRAEHLERAVAVPRHPLPREQRGPTHPADGGGDKTIGEPEPLARQPVQMRRAHNRVARRAQGVVAPVVRIQQHHVQRTGRVRGGWRGAREQR